MAGQAPTRDAWHDISSVSELRDEREVMIVGSTLPRDCSCLRFPTRAALTACGRLPASLHTIRLACAVGQETWLVFVSWLLGENPVVCVRVCVCVCVCVCVVGFTPPTLQPQWGVLTERGRERERWTSKTVQEQTHHA